MLKRSLTSLADRADDVTRIELLLAFDEDDTSSLDYFNQDIAPDLDARGVTFVVLGFPRLGYLRLNEYINHLCEHATGKWLFFWGDDAVMESQGWDTCIAQVENFRVLRISTHNLHPYAIFPIVPRKWFEIFGYMSAHQLTDSWVSQIGYLTDKIQDIPVQVTHDRFDLTGNNDDDTFRNRPMLEGNPKDPRDFNHETWRRRRFEDAGKIVEHLRQLGDDVSWYENVQKGQQDPWAKMCSPECDPNGQLTRFNTK